MRQRQNRGKLKRMLLAAAGTASMVLGCIGIVIPVLPTVPFFLLTVFCFANSSERLHDWFIGTGMYKKHLESFVKRRGMTLRTKVTVMVSVTVMMGIGFWMMDAVPAGRAVLAAVWLWHVLYFVFRIRTIPAGEENAA